MWGYVRICLLCADMFKRRLGADQATSSVARRARWSEPGMYAVLRLPTVTPLSCTQAGEGLHMTYPAMMPIAEIDHIVHDKGVTVGNLKTAYIPGSDHRALLATLEVA